MKCFEYNDKKLRRIGAQAVLKGQETDLDLDVIKRAKKLIGGSMKAEFNVGLQKLTSQDWQKLAFGELTGAANTDVEKTVKDLVREYAPELAG